MDQPAPKQLPRWVFYPLCGLAMLGLAMAVSQFSVVASSHTARMAVPTVLAFFGIRAMAQNWRRSIGVIVGLVAAHFVASVVSSALLSLGQPMVGAAAFIAAAIMAALFFTMLGARRSQKPGPRTIGTVSGIALVGALVGGVALAVAANRSAREYEEAKADAINREAAEARRSNLSHVRRAVERQRRTSLRVGGPQRDLVDIAGIEIGGENALPECTREKDEKRGGYYKSEHEQAVACWLDSTKVNAIRSITNDAPAAPSQDGARYALGDGWVPVILPTRAVPAGVSRRAKLLDLGGRIEGAQFTFEGRNDSHYLDIFDLLRTKYGEPTETEPGGADASEGRALQAVWRLPRMRIVMDSYWEDFLSASTGTINVCSDKCMIALQEETDRTAPAKSF